MASRIRIRRSSVPSNRPSISQLKTGELTLNTYDGRLFAIRDEQNALGIGSTVTLLTPWTENIGGGIYYTDSYVGIGTTVPTSDLHVQGQSLITGISTFNSNVQMDSDLNVDGNIRVGGYSEFVGVVTFRGGTINLGDSPDDDINFIGEFGSSVIPTNTRLYDLGTAAKEWKTLFSDSVVVSGVSTFNNTVDINHSVNISGVTTFQDDIYLGNNDVIYLGAADAFQIYHDGTDSIIRETGAGDLFLRATAAIRLQNQNGTENYAVFNVDGSSELYYNNSKKLETTTSGVDLTGTLNVAGVTTFLSFVDFNTDMDIDGQLHVDDLYVAGVSTFFNAVYFQNQIKGYDNDKIVLGNSNDFQIYHNGNSYIDNNTNNIFIRSNVDNDDGGNIYIQAKSGENSIYCADDSSVYLYYDGSTKLFTYSGGVSVNGEVDADFLDISGGAEVDGRFVLRDSLLVTDNLYVSGVSTFINRVDLSRDFDVDGKTDLDDLTVAGVATFQSNVYFGDTDKLNFGNDNDLQIYWSGTQNRIDTKNGPLRIDNSSTGISLWDNANTNYMAEFNTGGSVELYFNGDKKFETTGIGITVYGNTETQSVNVTGVATFDQFTFRNAVLEGPSETVIDPAGVGDNTGSVRIKGNLLVDGEQFVVNSSTIELKDFQVGIASDVATDSLLDGAGIGIGSTNIRKTLTYDFSSDSLKSSEHFDLASNKTYKINETEVLRHDQLTIPRSYVSGVSTVTGSLYLKSDSEKLRIGTDNDLEIYHNGNTSYIDNNDGNLYIRNNVNDDDGGNIYIQAKSGETSIAMFDDGGVNLYYNAQIRQVVTNYGNQFYGAVNISPYSGSDDGGLRVSGVTTFLSDARFEDNKYIYMGASSDLQIGHTGGYSLIRDIGTGNLAIGADDAIDFLSSDLGEYKARFLTNEGILLYYNGKQKFETLEKGVGIGGSITIDNDLYAAGVSTLPTLNGTELTYTTADIDTAYVTTGIVTTLQGTDVTYANAYVTTGIITTLQGTDVSYTNAYVNTGVVTTLNVPSDGVLDVDGKTNLDDLNVAGVATFTGGSAGTTRIGFGNTGLIVEGDARITGILTIGTSSVTIDGDNNQINVGAALTIDGTTNVIYLGDDVTIDNSGLAVAGVSSITATTIYGDIDGELNAPGNTYYVATTGDNNHTGDNLNQPYLTLEKALSVAGNGDIIYLAAGVYEETCPLTVPRGVTVKGAGLRATTIKPTDATKTENVFHLNDISTVEDLTIKDSFYRTSGDTGYAFAYAPGIAITSRSPYVQRVTVLNRGSIVTTDDPYGYDTADAPPTSYLAGRGAKVDGSLVDSESLEAGMLFNEVTFFTPNNKGVVLTNGARAEYLNCFHYFASQAIVGESGSVGIASTAGARLNVVGNDVTPSANDVVKQFDGNGDVVAIGTVKTFNSPYIVLTEKGSGIFTAIGAGSTNDVRFYQSDGVTQTGVASRVAFADYAMFGAEMRSVGCAVEYGSQGVVADGDGVNLRMFALNFNHVGSGKDFSNDPTLANQSAETTELNNGQVSYVSIDHKGDFRVGESFFVNQETGNVSFAATTFNLEVTGNMDVTDGVDTSTLTPTSLSVGNLQLSGNTVSSVAGNITIDPSGSNKTFVQGDLGVVGILTAQVLDASALQKGDTSVAVDDTGSDGTIRLNTDGTEAMRVDNQQRIGIGTAAPATHLDILGNTDIEGQTQIIGDLSVSGVSTFQDNITLNSDTAKLRIGTDDDLEIYHNGNISYIDNNDGSLYIRNNVNDLDGGNIYIQAKSGENSIVCLDDSGVYLYFDASQRFVTRQYGGQLYGTLRISASGGNGGLEVQSGVSTLPTLVGTNLTYASADIDNAYVTTGIVTTLQGTDATYANLYGVVGVVTTISGTDVNYTNANLTSADIDNAYVVTGIVTTLQGTDVTYTNAYVNTGVVTTLSGTDVFYTNGNFTSADIDNAYVTTGIVTTLQGTDVTYTNAYINTGVVTTISGTDVNYTNANLTSADIDNAYVTTGIVTTLQGTDATYTNLYGVAGVVTSIAGSNLNYTQGVLDNGYVVTGIVTTLQGTDVTYTNAYVNTGVVTTISGTDVNYTNANLTSADIDNAYVTTGIVTTLQGTDATYTNLYGVAGVVTSIAGSNLNYTQGVLDNGYVVTGIVTTLQGTDVTYDNAYVTTGVVTTIQGTDASYTNVYANVGVVTSLSIPANGTFDVDGKTDLDDLSVAGVATFTNSSGTALLVTGNAKIVGVLTVGSSSVEIDGLTDEIHVGSATTLHTGGYQIGNSDIHTSGATLEHLNVLGVSTIGVELSAGGVVTANTGGLNVAGVTTATALHLGAEGSAIRVTSDTISGPATINIDPAGVGDNTGTVVIKGDLQVDGTQTIVNSTTVTIDDKNIVIASGAANDAAADGGGITLESGDGNKTITWIDSTDSWTFSEHIDLASGHNLRIGGSQVLSSTELTVPNIYATGVTTASNVVGSTLHYTQGVIDNAYLNVGVVTTISGTDVNYTNANLSSADIDNAYVTVGVVTTISGTDANYTNANLTSADIDNAYVTTGIVTTLQGTDVTYDNAYVTSGIITTLQGTDASYTNAYVNTGVTTTLAGSNLNYTQGTLDNGYIVSGIVTTLQGTDVTYDNAYVTTGVVTTISGNEVTYNTGNFDNVNVDNISVAGIITANSGGFDVSGISTFAGSVSAHGAINSNTDVQINGTSVLTSASDEAVALAIALG